MVGTAVFGYFAVLGAGLYQFEGFSRVKLWDCQGTT